MAHTKKKPYTKSKRFDRSCRNHGGCSYCASNRMHKNRKRALSASELEQADAPIANHWARYSAGLTDA
jgi:hypothetical protein